MSFPSLGLAEPLVRAVEARGYTQPTPIQLQAIPAVLSGGDLLAGAQTGTGKTAAFTLPILQRLSDTPASVDASGKRPIRTLILTPTRELAAQVQESVTHYGANLPIKSMVMFGGVSINPQIQQLRNGVDILVATPGRLLDHVQQRTLDLSHIEILVLDEADRMLDMGFIHDIRRILNLLPAKRQNLLFSATFADEIKTLADKLLNSPTVIEVARRNAAADTVAQRVLLVDRERKRELLAHLITRNNWYQVLVFTRTKHGANRLAEQLLKEGIPAMAIHGNKSQGARTKALGDFKAGKLQVLVATDIAARGIDINELPHVVNFELPNISEDYVHRIGRTGRAGAEGEALSLVCVDELKLLSSIERTINRKLDRQTLEGFEPDPTIKAEPIQRGRQGQSSGGGREQGTGDSRSRHPQRSGLGQHGQRATEQRATGERGGSRTNEQRTTSGQRTNGQPGQRQRHSERPNATPRPAGNANNPRATSSEQRPARSGGQPLTNENRLPFEGVVAVKRPRTYAGAPRNRSPNNSNNSNNSNRSGTNRGRPQGNPNSNGNC